MAAVDFITAFGRLLRDGAMRDAFASNPRAIATQLHLHGDDLSTLMQLVPADLEFQARVLINKRLDVVRRFIPETCRLLGVEIKPAFHAYARTNWPHSEQSPDHDAREFCRHIKRNLPGSICEGELNRLNFAFSQKRFASHFLCHGRFKPGLQFFLRLNRQRWREFMFYFSL